jgi:CRISPR/Cas system CSM-associated protein Csm3 (group 7 of RAMP superfamily)
MEVWAIDLCFVSPFHSTGTNMGSFIQVTRGSDAKGMNVPYIPATHLKGVMRCEAERIMRTVAGISCYITGRPDVPGHVIEVCDEVKTGGYKCPVCSLFGVPNIDGGGGFREGKLRFLDFYPSRENEEVKIERRSHVMINRKYLVKEKGALYSEEAVPSGTIFTGNIIVRSVLSEEEERLFMASLHAMAGYGLGKNRSRGFGAIKIGNIRKSDHVMVSEVR